MINRIQRVNELIRKELNNLIQIELADKCGMTTVNFVDTQKDLKSAKVYVSGIWNMDSDKIINIFQKKAYFFQNILAKKMTSKNIPKLEFIFDISQDKIDKIEKLLSQIEKEKHDA